MANNWTLTNTEVECHRWSTYAPFTITTPESVDSMYTHSPSQRQSKLSANHPYHSQSLKIERPNPSSYVTISTQRILFSSQVSVWYMFDGDGGCLLTWGKYCSNGIDAHHGGIYTEGYVSFIPSGQVGAQDYRCRGFTPFGTASGATCLIQGTCLYI